MERIRTTEVQAHVSERVCVQGWLHAVRRLGGVNFLLLRDGWGTVQAVTEQEADLAPITQAELQTESLIALEGLVVASAQAPGGVELQQLQITVLTPVREALPVLISKREVKAQLPVLLDHAVVTNRHPGRRALFRLSAGVMAAFRGYLNSIGFTEIQTPKVVASATESGANVFAIDYFGRPAYLAQSPQFYKQIMVGVFERVFEVGPVFRAEPHATARHLSEYVSMDLELGFIENHFTVMGVLRNLLDHIFTTLQSQYSAELALVGANLPTVPATIPHLHFSEAKELVYQLYGVDERNEPDLSPQEERWLGAWAQSEHGSDFLFVTGYPMSKRPFYTHPDPARPAYSNSFDLLFRGIELVTGGQRLHRYEDYLAALAARKLSTEPFVGYLEAFRYGMPPHGGLAIGLERLLMQLTGAANLRETTLFPRDLSRLTP
jgi:nondiscriminating aspartyl-tRNA synthetase